MRPIFTKPVIASLIVCSAAALVLAGLLVGEVKDSDSMTDMGHNMEHNMGHSSHNSLNTNANIGGAFTLLNTSGQEVQDYHYSGQYLLIYFGFTNCPDVCPTALTRISTALDMLEADAPDQAYKIQPLLITTDPERDTPETMRDYVRLFHPRLEGLTGSVAQIDAVKKAYKVYATKAEDPTSSAHYTMNHSSIIYLMDGNNKFLTHFTDIQTSEEIAAKLKTLIAK